MKKLILIVFLIFFSVKAIATESGRATIIGLQLGMTAKELVTVIENTTPLKCHKTVGTGKNQEKKGYYCVTTNSCKYFKYQA